MTSRLPQLVSLIRAHMRDYPQLNRLIQGEESGDRAVATALYDAIDDFNLSSPLSAYTVDSFPATALLITGAMKFLLESLSILQTRNQLTYSDGQGTQVSVSNRGPAYLNIVQKLSQEWEAKKERLIIRLNVRSMMGSGVNSDFRSLDDSLAEPRFKVE